MSRFFLFIPWKHIRFALLLWGISLIIQTILRIALYWANHTAFVQTKISDILLGFIVGIRFDLAITAIFSGLCLFFLSFPLKLNLPSRFPAFWASLALLSLIPPIVLNAIDIGYFGIVNRRSTYELIALFGEIGRFVLPVIQEYSYIIAPILLVIVAVWLFLKKQASRIIIWADSPYQWFFPCLTIGILLVSIRGGIQFRPLRPADAFVSTDRMVGHLGGNSAYTFLTALSHADESSLYFIPDSQAIAIVRPLFKNSFDTQYISDEFPLLRQTQFNGPEKRYNVVFILMESLTAELVGSINPESKYLSPNLDRLASEGILCTRYYNNSSRTIESLPVIYNSIPNVLHNTFIGSEMETNGFVGIPQLLNKRNYHTSFFHGATNGTMGFTGYTKISGIQHYFGLNEWKEPLTEKNFDGAWGIYDELYLNYFYEHIQTFPQPFCATFFSLTNHHPWNLPPNCDSITQLPVPKSVQTSKYADAALGKFFDKIRNDTRFDSTIFVITGDHTGFGFDKEGRNFMDHKHSPLIIWAPKIIKPQVIRTPVKALDIEPTLIQLLQLHTLHASFGTSIIDSTAHHFATFCENGIFTYADSTACLSTNHEQYHAHLLPDGNRWKYATQDDLKNLDQLTLWNKAIYQVMKNSVLQNKIIGDTYLKAK